MRFGGEMDDAVHTVAPERLENRLEVADVRLEERVVRPVLDVVEVRQVSGIGEIINVDNVIIRIFVHKQSDDVASDETCAACDDNRSAVMLHIS